LSIDNGNAIEMLFGPLGAFNNYVEKMRRGGGQKMSVFVYAQGIKTVYAGGGGKKIAKLCPRSF
jgi:hypothetical protein